MQLVRFHIPDHGARLGLLAGDKVHDLTASGRPELTSLMSIVQASLRAPIPDLLGGLEPSGLPTYSFAALDQNPNPAGAHLLPPVDRQEVWAAGVTYAWSREARVREAVAKDVYVRVYEAERPELFFKSTAERVVGPNDWIGIRGDSEWNVPEPELTLLVNPALEIIGFTAGNDVSSRDIEGANPLYLPQAKVYRHSCALGPAVTLAGDGFDPNALLIQMTISREGTIVFEGETNTQSIHRRLEELAQYLGRYYDLPAGCWLMTGTGIVPGDEFTLQDGDQVRIEIQGIGALTNVVKQMQPSPDTRSVSHV